MSIGIITKESETKNIYNNASEKKRILVVEDDKILGKIFEHQLYELGYDCDIAKTSKDTLILLNPVHSMILIDVGLPDMSGWHLAKQIKLLDAPICNIPIIMHSAHANQEIINQNKNFNDGFISKPIDRKKLTLMLSNILHD